jgi:hypothetical protein
MSLVSLREPRWTLPLRRDPLPDALLDRGPPRLVMPFCESRRPCWRLTVDCKKQNRFACNSGEARGRFEEEDIPKQPTRYKKRRQGKR